MAMARWRQNQMAMKRATVIMATSGNEDGDQDADSCLFVCLLLLINLSLSPKNLLFELFFVCLSPTYEDVVYQVEFWCKLRSMFLTMKPHLGTR